MKKMMSIMMSGVLSAALLAGCGSSTSGSSAASTAEDTTAARTDEASAEALTEAAAAPAEAATEAAAAEDTEAAVESTEDAADDSSILVLYYSGTGHTKSVADMIASYTGADAYEVTPAEPYTDDDLNYNDENSRVVQEYENPDLQDVAFDSTDVPDWDSYDTVFLGYPIWWQDASWVMKSFVRNVDFTGKTVIPFCTSGASGIGDSAKNLEEIAGTGTWLDGQRFSSRASEEDVEAFVDSLNL